MCSMAFRAHVSAESGYIIRGVHHIASIRGIHVPEALYARLPILADEIDMICLESLVHHADNHTTSIK